ncbi:M23 family metallopeptidase [Streptomyces sp. NPDC000594]|uniref:M23 family metallopeptidase n=1 Tax=Streptomyces sp. NPDC000594 TaxID=3154261 RepID=UPI00332E3EC1
MSVPTGKLLMVLLRFAGRLFVVLFLCLVLTPLPVSWWLVAAPWVVMMGAMLALSRRGDREHRARVAVPPGEPGGVPPAVETEAPVRGRWSATNSPADKVPSHGLHAYGQTYAIDLTAEPEPVPGPGGGGGRPGFSLFWPVVRRNESFPAFGQPLYAVADATVVEVHDRQRDHLSRTSLLSLLYLMLLEGTVRELVGPSRIIGNRVVLDLGDGTYALYAHVQRGSVTVRPGDRVRAGQPIARCGNSGNSTEPHVHFHLMDGLDLDTARGIPFHWRGVGVPAGKEIFTVDSSAGQERSSAEAVTGAADTPSAVTT